MLLTIQYLIVICIMYAASFVASYNNLLLIVHDSSSGATLSQHTVGLHVSMSCATSFRCHLALPHHDTLEKLVNSPIY